jgi:hypothetical protein
MKDSEGIEPRLAVRYDPLLPGTKATSSTMMRPSDLNLLRFHKAGPLLFDAVKELLGVSVSWPILPPTTFL